MAINKNKLIASAQRLTQRGQLDRAIKEYRTIVEADPDDVRVWMKIGALYVRKGATQHAVATYNRVAAHYQDAGHHQKAAAVYKQIIGLVPGAIDAHLQLAEVLARLGQNLEAVNELQIVVGAYEREGRHRDSCSLLARIVELAPNEEANRIRLAEAYARQDDNEAAIREFRLVLDQLHGNQRYDDFIQVAERLLYLAPGQLQTVRQLAEVYLQRAQPKRALSRLQVLFQHDPTDTAVLGMLGQAFNDLGYRGKAISVYRELARIHASNGAEGLRLDAYRTLLAIDPKDPEALEATGSVDRFSQPPSAAAVSAVPHHESVPQSAGDQVARYLEDVQLYLKYELTEHALGRLEKIEALDPDNAEALAQKAELMRQLDRPGEAVSIYRQLAERAVGEQAMSFLGKVIELRPDDIDAQARLRSLSGDMASAHAKVVTIPPAQTSVEDPYEVDLNLDGVDFDDGLEAGFTFDDPMPQSGDISLEFELDLDALEPAPDDDAFSDLLGADEPGRQSVESGPEISRRAFGDLADDDEFGDLLEPDASTSLGASGYDDVDGLALMDTPAGDDDFGDLLADDGWRAPRQAADVGGLLGDAPAPASRDDFGDLLGEVPEADDEGAPVASGIEGDFGDLLAEPAAPAGDDDFGDLLAGSASGVLTPPPAVEDEIEAAQSLADADDELAAPTGDDVFGDVIALAPPAGRGLLAPEPSDAPAAGSSEMGFSDIADDQVIHLVDDSFGDLLADFDDDYPEQPAAETAEVVPALDGALDEALAAAVEASGAPVGSGSVPDVDFGALDASAAPAPIEADVDFGALDASAAPEPIEADVDFGALGEPAGVDQPLDLDLDGLDFDEASLSGETPPPEVKLDGDAFAIDLDPMVSEAPQAADLFADAVAEPEAEDAPFDSLLDDLVDEAEQAAADMHGGEAMVEALPGVIEAMNSIDLVVDDDEIIELDDSEFEVESIEEVDLDQPLPPPPLSRVADSVAPESVPPSARMRRRTSVPPPTPPSLQDRLARIGGGRAARPAPPPLPGGSLFDLRSNEAISDAPEPMVDDGPELEESLAGAEFFNIGGDVDWPSLDGELAELDQSLSDRDVSQARLLLSELNQEHPGHPALSDRLDRILEIETGGEPSAVSEPQGMPVDALPGQGFALDDVDEATFEGLTPPALDAGQGSPLDGLDLDDLAPPPAAQDPWAEQSEPMDDRIAAEDGAHALDPSVDEPDYSPDEALAQGLLSSLEEAGLDGLGEDDADALLGGLDDGVDFGTVQGSMLSDLDADDASTHFDLGVAFKEMGQYRKAIESLELARQNRELYAEATRILAAAHHERGESSNAVDLLREAIGDDRVTQAAQLGLRYELAGIFETVGRHLEAADELRIIADLAPNDFPDVGARLARLS